MKYIDISRYRAMPDFDKLKSKAEQKHEFDPTKTEGSK